MPLVLVDCHQFWRLTLAPPRSCLTCVALTSQKQPMAKSWPSQSSEKQHQETWKLCRERGPRRSRSREVLAKAAQARGQMCLFEEPERKANKQESKTIALCQQ